MVMRGKTIKIGMKVITKNPTISNKNKTETNMMARRKMIKTNTKANITKTNMIAKKKMITTSTKGNMTKTNTITKRKTIKTSMKAKVANKSKRTQLQGGTQ